MDKKVLKKRMRSWFALVLALAMMFGSSLTVFAGNIDLYNGQNFEVNETVLCGGDVICEQTSGYYVKIWIDGELKLDLTRIEGSTNFTLPGTPDTKYLLTQCEWNYPANETYYLAVSLSTISKPEPTSEPEKEQTDNHEHSYSWVTVREAQIGRDGLEEYRCSCGSVKESRAISSSKAFVNGMVDLFKKAPLNGVVEYESGPFYTMTDKMLKQFSERNDLTLIVTFEYKGTRYKMTVPSGVDYSEMLADDENFYGYFYFALLTGATMEIVE